MTTSLILGGCALVAIGLWVWLANKDKD